MKLLEVNDNVVHNRDGRNGMVVEVGSGSNLGRYRVLWYHRNGTPDKRTWMKADAIHRNLSKAEIAATWKKGESTVSLADEDNEGPDEPNLETCPACRGPAVFLGKLGNLDHYRCRDCGLQNSRPVAKTLREVAQAALTEGRIHQPEAGCGL